MLNSFGVSTTPKTRVEIPLDKNTPPRHDGVLETAVSTDEYRRILSDHKSTDEQITKRIQYIEALCRNIIKQEIENYVKKIKGKK